MTRIVIKNTNLITNSSGLVTNVNISALNAKQIITQLEFSFSTNIAALFTDILKQRQESDFQTSGIKRDDN